MKKILVFGKHGQVANSLKQRLPSHSVYLGSSDVDFSSDSAVEKSLNQIGPSHVINTAAYTMVDKAEEEKSKCFQINSKAPRTIANWCNRHGAQLIHFSTDYVYQGQGTAIQDETAAVGPKNTYGESKLAGENYIRDSGCNHIILRTSWIYSEYGNNFVKTMLNLGKSRKEIKVVYDQVGSPTYALDLADAVDKILQSQRNNHQATYNICNSGFTSWHSFATEIFESAKNLGIPLQIDSVLPITSDEYNTAAKRPLNSRLSTDRIMQHFDISLPSWQSSLKLCLGRIIANENNKI